MTINYHTYISMLKAVTALLICKVHYRITCCVTKNNENRQKSEEHCIDLEFHTKNGK